MSSENNDAKALGNGHELSEEELSEEELKAEAKRLLQERLGELAEAGRIIQERLRELVDTGAALEEGLQQGFSGSDYKRLAETFAQTPDRHRRLQPYLAERSWCLPGRAGAAATEELEVLIDADEHEAVEAFLVEHMKEDFGYMKRFVLSRNPEREEILSEAFEAHEGGLYAASIPLMLIQGEGISEELFGGSVYASEEALQEKLEAALEEHQGEVETASVTAILFEPLTEVVGFTERAWERSEAPAGVATKYPLNRHAVIHEKDLGYATEANGLRGVALLTLLSEAKETLERGTRSSSEEE